jgi:hypothetical protein
MVILGFFVEQRRRLEGITVNSFLQGCQIMLLNSFLQGCQIMLLLTPPLNQVSSAVANTTAESS